MKNQRDRWTRVFCALACLCTASTTALAETGGADARLSALSDARLGALVSDLDALYKHALDLLYTVHKDGGERELGLRVGSRALADYDARVAGRCTKILISQALNEYIQVAYARMQSAKESPATGLITSYAALLKKYGLGPGDLKQTGDCPVYEYDLEPLYESPITVFDPWFFNGDRHARTFIRFVVKRQKADGTIDLEAWVGAGRPKGRYVGVARRDLHSATIQVSLMRDKEPLLIEGELTMSGMAYKDPLSNEPAPKMPARVLTGFLQIRDGEQHTLNNAVMLVARGSDAEIGTALGGFKVPGDAEYGSYLNTVLVSFRGRGIGRDYVRFKAIVDAAYAKAQRENPVRSFHPTRDPLFVKDDEVAFLVMDIASDVNALAVRQLRSAETYAAAARLGARATVVPFFRVKDGELRIQFPGRRPGKLKFEGFEGLAKSLFTMYAALNQEQQQIFERFGIKKLSNEIRALQASVGNAYQAMGPWLDQILEGQPVNESLDKRLSAEMDALLKAGQAVDGKLASILDTRDMRALIGLHADYVAKRRAILVAASATAPVERADAMKTLFRKFDDQVDADSKRVSGLASAIAANADAIAATLNYMNTFSARVELAGKYVAADGKLVSWEWTWERTMPHGLEKFFLGGNNETKRDIEQPGRLGH